MYHSLVAVTRYCKEDKIINVISNRSANIFYNYIFINDGSSLCE